MLEVVLAVTVVSMVLVAVAGLFCKTTQLVTRAGEYTAAANLAQGMLEELKAKDNSFWQACDEEYRSPVETVLLNGRRYQCFYHIKILPDHDRVVAQTLRRLAQVAVWTQAEHSPVEVNFNTYIPFAVALPTADPQ